MGHAIDLLHTAFVEVQRDGTLLHYYDFILSIFEPLYLDLPELKEYLEYHIEDKMGNVIGSMIEME